MSLLLQHMMMLYAKERYDELPTFFAKAEEMRGPLPRCLYREIDYARSGGYRAIRDERFFPIRFLWFLELHEQVMLDIPPLSLSRYHPERLYDMWRRLCEDESFRKDMESEGLLVDVENKAVLLTRGWTLIGETFRDDLMEIEAFFQAELLFPDKDGSSRRPAFAEYKTAKRETP